MQPSDIEALIALAINPPVVVIAPDRHRSGTNALLLSPSGLFDYSFGPGSFQKHCEKTKKSWRKAGNSFHPFVELDLDLPEDLEILRKFEKDIPSLKITSNSIH